MRYRLRRTPLPKKLVRLLSSFLRDRKLTVYEGSTRSKTVTMKSGVPQGAILSPDIFTITSKDTPIANDEDEGGSQFADDVSTWASGRTAREAIYILKRRLATFEKWAKKWSLYPSASKSFLICFTNSPTERKIAEESEILLLGNQVSWTKEIKLLGANFDDKLDWSGHIDSIIKKCHPKVFSLCKLNRRMNFSNRKLILDTFDSLVSSAFHYSAPAFLNMSEKNWLKVENFYNRSLKCIFDLPPYMSSLRARELFRSRSFRQQIEDRATSRIGDIITSTGFISDMVYGHAKLEGKDTVLDRVFRIMGIERELDCNFCPFDAEHDCVPNEL